MVLTTDCRKAFRPIHPPGTLSSLPPEAHLGLVDLATLPKAESELTPEEKRIKEVRSRLPPPEAALNLLDIEVSEDLVRLDEA
jgi:L-lactate dehydrogenase (cytochrome)